MAEVRFAKRALASLNAQEAWLRARNPQAADRFVEDVETCALLLSEHTLSGRLLAGTTLRMISTTRFRYRLFYRVRDGVRVVRVLHPRQDG